MPRISYQKRTFLNPPSTSTTSYVMAEVASTYGGQDVWGSNILTIADCHKRVQFDFCIGNRKARRRSLAKINLLLEVLSGFRDALQKEIELIERAK